MATPLDQLEAMRSIPANWDGYDADPPDPNAIELGKAFVQLLDVLRRDAHEFPMVHVGPTRSGGVQLEWEDRVFEHELEIEPDGTVEILHENKATREMTTRKFAPDPRAAAHPGLLLELRHLSAA